MGCTAPYLHYIDKLRILNVKNIHHFPWEIDETGIRTNYESACQCRRCEFDPWVGKIPWRRAWQPTPVLLPGESHRQRSLAGYSPWGCKESDMAEGQSSRIPSRKASVNLEGKKRGWEQCVAGGLGWTAEAVRFPASPPASSGELGASYLPPSGLFRNLWFIADIVQRKWCLPRASWPAPQLGEGPDSPSQWGAGPRRWRARCCEVTAGCEVLAEPDSYFRSVCGVGKVQVAKTINIPIFSSFHLPGRFLLILYFQHYLFCFGCVSCILRRWWWHFQWLLWFSILHTETFVT